MSGQTAQVQQVAYFTQVSNSILQDKRLDYKHKGLLSTVIGFGNNGWRFSVAGLIATVPDGKNSTYRIIRELIQFRYCKRYKFINSKTRQILGTHYQFYQIEYEKDNGIFPEDKVILLDHDIVEESDYPPFVNTPPLPDFPNTGNQTQYNINKINNKELETAKAVPIDSIEAPLAQKQTEPEEKIDQIVLKVKDLPRKRKTYLQVNWLPKQTEVDRLREQLDLVNIQLEIDRFKEHYIGTTAKSFDWDARFLTWVGNKQTWEKEKLQRKKPESNRYTPKKVYDYNTVGTLEEEMEKYGLKMNW